MQFPEKLINRKSLRLYKGPGVYIFLDSSGKPTYVGKSINIFERVKNHLASNDVKELALRNASTSVKQIPVAHELEALLLEASLIKKYLPKYNSTAKDDKHPLYIKITKEEFPKVFTSRIQEKGAKCFGPFPSSTIVRNVLKQLRKVFPYCAQTQIGKRGCFYSHIGLCDPCPSVVVKYTGLEREILVKRYKQNLRKIVSFLEGKEKVLKKEVKKEMEDASKHEDYEEAARLRDQLEGLYYITSPYKSASQYIENPRLLGETQKNQVQELYDVLVPHIPTLTLPVRIDCFDNAHLSGKNATASLVVFVDAQANKSLYRRFRIRTEKTKDDFAMMSEVIKRRMGHVEDWGKPDLIVVDGGKGQVSAAKLVMDQKFGGLVPIIGLAKRLEEIVIPTGGNFKIIRLRPGNPALSLLQRLRDEAHRFARSYHFKLRLKELLPKD